MYEYGYFVQKMQYDVPCMTKEVQNTRVRRQDKTMEQGKKKTKKIILFKIFV